MKTGQRIWSVLVAMTVVCFASACHTDAPSAGQGGQTTKSTWRPPKDPDPSQILDEAEADAQVGRYADALAKQVWFHENALKYQPAMYGVRLSFALGSWKELGDVYPPAMAKLKSVRDQAEKQVREGQADFDDFHDLTAINDSLQEGEKTKELFLWLDANKPEFAQSVFSVAESDLIRAKEYQLCGKYIGDAEETYVRMEYSYRMHQQMARKPEFGAHTQRFGEMSFTNDCTTLIALLAVNGRQEEADRIAEQASKAWDDPEFHKKLEEARQGIVPEPWP
ncbi:MAG: hypothetical protein IT443_08720 [Phycisphaeraceae bacterium]|nr:hypothetical protein [Phycisphaeraceae bacterium]